MSEPVQPHDWETRTRRVRDVANILPFAAVLLLLPPVVLVFAAPVTLGGVPLIVLYIYGVWTAVILVALVVARLLERADRGNDG